MGWLWGWHQKGEEPRAGSSGRSQLRLAVPRELRPRFCSLLENWKQYAERGPWLQGWAQTQLDSLN